MRVFLIYPPISMEERYSSDIGHAGGRQLPLGIFYLAAYIRANGHEVQVVDAEARGLSAWDLAAMARDYQPQVVGISTTTVSFHRALEVAGGIKSLLPDIKIILGGPHVSAAAHDSMSHADFDLAVVGEGEDAFLRVLAALEEGCDPKNLEGVAFRKDGEVHVNPPGPFISDLDALPFPAYDLVPDLRAYNPPPANYKKLPVANVLTGRGCPQACTFCDRSLFGRRLRLRSAENIAAEIEYLYRRHHVREIAFVDENFTVRPGLLYELFEILDKRGIQFPWTCMSRIDTVDHDLLAFMKNKGCWHISFGIESGNEEILKRIRKKISLPQAEKVVRLCRGLGIRTKGFFIIGHPGETIETMEESIKTALTMPLDDVVVTLNTPLPGTDQFKEAVKWGDLPVTDWSRFNMWSPVFVPNGLTRQILVEKHREFYRRFYMRPRIMARYAFSFLSASGIRRAPALFRSLPFLLKGKRSSRGKQ